METSTLKEIEGGLPKKITLNIFVLWMMMVIQFTYRRRILLQLWENYYRNLAKVKVRVCQH